MSDMTVELNASHGKSNVTLTRVKTSTAQFKKMQYNLHPLI